MFVETVGKYAQNVEILPMLVIQFGFVLPVLINLVQNVVLVGKPKKGLLEPEEFAIPAIR